MKRSIVRHVAIAGVSLSMLAGIAPFATAGTLSAASRLAESQGAGKVAGKVIDSDGKAVGNAKISLFKKEDFEKALEQMHSRAQAARPGRVIKLDDLSPTTKPSASLRIKPVAKGQTDAEGKFALTDVPAGEYVVFARLKKSGMGHEDVTVTADQTADISITLKVPGK